jgi:hypothetical protein
MSPDKEWIEVHQVGGKPVSFLMENCSECGAPKKSRIAVVCSDDEYVEFEKSYKDLEKIFRSPRLKFLFFAAIAVSMTGCIIWLFLPEIDSGWKLFLSGAAVILSIIIGADSTFKVKTKKRIKKYKTEREKLLNNLLSTHDELPPEEILAASFGRNLKFDVMTQAEYDEYEKREIPQKAESPQID